MSKNTYNPRTLVIEWDHVQYNGSDHNVYTRVKTIEHAEKRMKKFNHENIHKAFYIDQDGKKHKMHVRK